MKARPYISNIQAASAADVARLAGVSRSTVSRTFTDGASVSADAREKVLRASEELHYHVNFLARGLSKQESRPVCILISNLHKPYHAQLLDHLTTALQLAQRISIIINVGDDPAAASAALEQTLNYRAAATIVLSGAPPALMVRRCVELGQRVILVNRADDLPDVQLISVDYETAMRNAVQMFLRAGCRTIALVSRAVRTPSLLAREDQFTRFLRAEGIEPQIWRGQSTTYQTGQQAMRALLAGLAPPDGVFCINDLMACGCIDTARREFGLRLPEDLCILGFDDIAQAAWAGYDLTTFAQPYAEIAQTAVNSLTPQSETMSARDIVLTARPIWRGTMRAGTARKT
jgi:DNA-binding LacI/PurR family transcriptional regulator